MLLYIKVHVNNAINAGDVARQHAHGQLVSLSPQRLL
jgi:hypothetical protein